MNSDDLRNVLKNQEPIQHPFEILRHISLLLCGVSTEHEGQELLLRALERNDQFQSYGEVLDSLIRSAGLMPYLDKEALSFKDAVAYEWHRPRNMEEDIVFHREQAFIYHRLIQGDSVILSAPTSFGKSRIIDAMVALEQFRNIAVIVPTIALIDETRRRLSRYRSRYKIITQLTQAPAAQNLFVFTAERAIAYEHLPKIDFFVIDEFYKLGALDEDTDRTVALNHIFYRLLKQGGQFYLLGPSVREIPIGFDRRFSCFFHRSPFSTVASDVEIVRTTPGRLEALKSLCEEIEGPTLIYCRSPKSVNEVAQALISLQGRKLRPSLISARRWIANNFHPDWILASALARGIGIHHGRLPRALAQYIVRAFDESKLNVLICTSTLIEGVNTKAKNVIIYDNKVAMKNIDFFTFNNIKGRSGRMLKHFVGRVFLFDPAPEEDLPYVDIPIFTQGPDTPDSLLLQMEKSDLTGSSRDRIKTYEKQESLTLSTIRANSGIPPDRQVALAQHIRSSPRPDMLGWHKFPQFEQLKYVCTLIWEYLADRKRHYEVRTPLQLAFKINQLSLRLSVRQRVESELKFDTEISPDEAVERVLVFDRYWAGFAFPKYLMAVSRIQEEVLQELGEEPGDYTVYASRVESLFGEPVLAVLDEFGIPTQVGEKLLAHIGPVLDLDETLNAIRQFDLAQIELDPFERELVIHAIADI